MLRLWQHLSAVSAASDRPPSFQGPFRKPQPLSLGVLALLDAGEPGKASEAPGTSDSFSTPEPAPEDCRCCLQCPARTCFPAGHRGPGMHSQEGFTRTAGGGGAVWGELGERARERRRAQERGSRLRDSEDSRHGPWGPGLAPTGDLDHGLSGALTAELWREGSRAARGFERFSLTRGR